MLLIVFFVLLNGFFVGAEFALVKVRESQIRLRAQSGNALAKWALHLVGHLDAYLSACQLGITLSSLALGWLGEPAMEKMLFHLSTTLNLSMSPELLHQLSFVLAFLTITFLHIVFGELVPKAIAIRKSEWTSYAVALPLRAFYVVFFPLIWSMNTVALKILKAIGIPYEGEGEIHTSEELQLLAQKSQEQGEMAEEKYKLVKNALEFDMRHAGQLMVARKDIYAVDLNHSDKEILKKVMESPFSRILAYRGNLDQVCGVIHQKDLAKKIFAGVKLNWQELLYQPLFVSAERSLNDLLRDFKKQRVHLCLVLDEYGATQGLISLEDVLEELVGEILDEDDGEALTAVVEVLDPRTYRVQSDQSRHEINMHLARPFPEGDHFHTLSGVILGHLGKLPTEGMTLELHDYEIVIEKVENRRIVQILLKDLLEN